MRIASINQEERRSGPKLADERMRNHEEAAGSAWETDRNGKRRWTGVNGIDGAKRVEKLDDWSSEPSAVVPMHWTLASCSLLRLRLRFRL